jgi:hypothetical protein
MDMTTRSRPAHHPILDRVPDRPAPSGTLSRMDRHLPREAA